MPPPRLWLRLGRVYLAFFAFAHLLPPSLTCYVPSSACCLTFMRSLWVLSGIRLPPAVRFHFSVPLCRRFYPFVAPTLGSAIPILTVAIRSLLVLPRASLLARLSLFGAMWRLALRRCWITLLWRVCFLALFPAALDERRQRWCAACIARARLFCLLLY
jgi:hypothetical protein